MMKFISGIQLNTKDVSIKHKMLVSLWVCAARHAQSTQSNKFAIPLQ